ncbi:MAG: nuclear transport factor 2 family protein [Xanthobacteraceae bacterium]|nr:nuclear transport factor 2 family protein [Xanthobacteraceae bacterium]
MSTDSADFHAVCELVQRTAMLLDEENFDDWLALFDDGGTYELSAYSSEIRRWMTWQLSDRDALEKMLGDVEEHVRDPARRRHVVSVPLASLDADRGRATSHFSLFRTTPDGQSSLYLVGRYEDHIVKRDGVWRYSAHKVVLDTRVLDTFTHIPV